MVRMRSWKNTLSFACFCLVLLALNNFFISQQNPDSKQVLTAIVVQSENCSNDVPDEKVCIVDGSTKLTCMKNGDDIFFPFSFLKKHFDISGKYSKDDVFEWSTSYAKVRLPDGNTYDPTGPFGHFSTYNVENRDRVRCISGVSGVPMSTQWRTEPYFYPIQIAQYGLQHFSRWKAANETSKIVDVGTDTKEWKGSPGASDTSERIFYQMEGIGTVLNISTSGDVSSPGCYVYLDEDSNLHTLNFTWLPYKNCSFTVLAKVVESNSLVLLNYLEGENDMCFETKDVKDAADQVSVFISVGELKEEWQTVTRDILVDVSRALSSSVPKKKKNVILHPGDIKLVTIGFRGHCSIKQQITQRNEAHRDFFLRAADWMVDNQNHRGGWAVPVERAIADRKLVLPAGWHSAMAQGHALSTLSRAYRETQNLKYLDSAARALDLFDTPAKEGGVLNEFFGQPWYEEYPTTPGTFVLNGFMYSLVGLFDFMSLKDAKDMNNYANASEAAERLFNSGINSLRNLLPLYDTGSGSIYDLRHVHLKTAPNLARWDYHAVHVYLLKWIYQITNDEFFNTVVERWVGYTYGKRAKHN